jgi:hypothetical protein
MLSVCVGCSPRQPVRNVCEKIGDVTIKVEHGPAGCRRASFTSRSLVHQRVSAAQGRNWLSVRQTHRTLV